MSHHLTAEHIDERMHECITLCSDCHDTCVETVVHCLKLGGEHASPDHIRALLDCAQACDTSRDFMLRGSDLHHRYCGACAEACDRCAESCESLAGDDRVMLNCADQCRRCAESCRQMAGAHA
jgi:hypothetical protein